jgi:uncharacterized protein YkwD
MYTSKIMPLLKATDEGKKKDILDFRRVCIEIHNLLRLLFGSAPLEWDDTLSERAQAWAIYLSSKQVSNLSAGFTKHANTNTLTKSQCPCKTQVPVAILLKS